MLNLFKKESPREKEPNGSTNFPKARPEDYYGRFTLTQVDNEVEMYVLQRWLIEVRLDFDNNRIKYEDTGLSKYRKQMNFCYFFRCRIEQKINEIRDTQILNQKILSKFNGTKSDRWKLLVEFITKRYPGMDLSEIMLLMDLEN